MNFQTDYIMRQIEELTNAFARLLFGKNSAEIVLTEEDRNADDPRLIVQLLARVAEGDINGAENELFSRSEAGEEVLEDALAFYRHLCSLEEAYLQRCDFSCEEIGEGLLDALRAAGYQVPSLPDLENE